MVRGKILHFAHRGRAKSGVTIILQDIGKQLRFLLGKAWPMPGEGNSLVGQGDHFLCRQSRNHRLGESLVLKEAELCFELT